MDKKSVAYKITQYAIIFALIFVAMMLDRVISLGFASLSFAVCTLLVTFAVCFVFNKWDLAVMTGVFFGLASWIKAFIFGEAHNQIPLVPIPARIIATIVAFSIYKLVLFLAKSMKPYGKQTLAMSVATLFGLVTNTVLYLSSIYLCRNMFPGFDGLWIAIKTTVYINIAVEYPIAIILVPHVALGVRRGLKLGVEALPTLEDDLQETT